MYMDNPMPLPINSNPGMVLPPQKFTTVHDLARFAARIVDAIVEHKELLDSGGLVLERCGSREKNQPMCMAQFYRLLGSCRRPGLPRDSQYLPEMVGGATDEHIVVMYRNQMYCLLVKADDRGRLSEDEIYSQLMNILNAPPAQSGAAAPQVGILSTQERQTWAKDRNLLLALGEQNQRNIELVEEALILLCIDEPLPPSFNARGFQGSPSSHHFTNGRDETNMAHQMIHGGGSKFNSGNRWFDKTFEGKLFSVSRQALSKTCLF